MGEPSRDKARRKIAQTAKAMAGAHYLNGAKGARPGQGGGARIRPGSVKLELITSLPNLAFLAASWMDAKAVKDETTGKTKWVPYEGGWHVCGGRYETIGGNLIDDTDRILKAYLGQQNPKDPSKCQTNGGWTPRRLAGKRDPKNSGRIVWGECCDGHRHFDCIGLVEFAVDQVVKQPRGGEIYQFASPKNVLGATPVTVDSDIMDGDLVSQVKGDDYHHIGIIYLEGGVPMVAQAKETSAGITVGTPYNKSSWNGGRWRLPASLLMADGEVSDDIPDNERKRQLPMVTFEVWV